MTAELFNKIEVPYYALYRRCNYRRWPFRYASQVAAPVETIGQERAEKALDMGLRIGYPFSNIYVTGASGTGKIKNTLKRVKKFASREGDVRDWCYVYNFKDSRRPAVLSFRPGGGSQFKRAVEFTVGRVREGILDLKGSKTFQSELKHLLSDYNAEKERILEALRSRTGEDKFQIKAGEEGLIFYPIRDGKVMTAEEYENLDEKGREEIKRDISSFYEDIFYTVEQLRNLEKEYRKRLGEIKAIHVRELVRNHFTPLFERYSGDDKVLEYLGDLQRDIEENFPELIEHEMEYAVRFRVNLLVDNSGQKRRPVIFETNPTTRNLVGQMEFDNIEGNLYTDFMMLKAGALHRAWGGFLVIPVKELLLSPGSWDALKLCLKKGEIDFGYSAYISGNLPVATLNPQPIPLNLKVILVGEEEIFRYLSCYDPDFEKLFGVKVDYQLEVERTFSTELKMARYIGYQVKANGMKDFHRSAVAALIEFSSRMAGKQHKLHTGLDHIFNLMVEAEACALREGDRVVKACHVKEALRLRDERNYFIEQKIIEKYRDNTLLLNIEGNRVGEINGVALVTYGESSFGRVLRITASCFRGDRGIISIEREVKNSGSAHAKGSLIIEGYLMGRYAAEDAGDIGITVNICLEQFYRQINDDSLSAAELLAVLSALGGIPLKQSIAVTGSVNQKGELQPVEGVNDRIEGFFKVCMSKGCREVPGIIIPRQNIHELSVKEEVVRAVKRRRFKIYAIEHIDQAIEILSGLKAGTENQDGEFPRGTAGYLIRKRIRNFFQ